jgi:IS5 family transposase
MAEVAFSLIKRGFGPAIYPRVWYHEFYELMLTIVVYKLEQASNSDIHVFISISSVTD